MRLSVDQRKKIFKLYQRGFTVNELADMFGVTKTTIRTWVERGRTGEYKDKPHPNRAIRKYSPEIVDRMEKLYKQGYSCREIAEMLTANIYGDRAGKPWHNVHYRGVSRALKKSGIEITMTGRQRAELTGEHAHACELRRQGAWLKEIMEKTGLSHGVILRTLRREGLYYMREINGELEFYDASAS